MAQCFYRATACNAMHGIAVAIMYVCLSVRCVYCDKTKWCIAGILIPHEREITLVFCHQRPLPYEICAQDNPPLLETPTSTDFCL